jgi:hypothetical protein
MKKVRQFLLYLDSKTRHNGKKTIFTDLLWVLIGVTLNIIVLLIGRLINF